MKVVDRWHLNRHPLKKESERKEKQKGLIFLENDHDGNDER